MLHCVPFPDAGAPAMMILGGGDPASIAIPLFRDAARAEQEVLLPESHTPPLLPVYLLATTDLCDNGREEIAVSIAAGLLTPNQLRVPDDDGACTTGFTKAESVVGGDLPSGAEAAAQQAKLSAVVSAKVSMQIRRRT